MATPSFEQSIDALENIVTKLEKGELSLEQALEQFEQGVQHAKTCQKALTAAEKKIAELSKKLDLNSNDE